MIFNKKLRALAASAAVIGLGTMSLSAAAQNTCPNGQRQLNGTIEFTETISFVPNLTSRCPGFVGTINGGGVLAGLGNVTVESVDCIIPGQANPSINGFYSDNLTFTIGSQKLYAIYSGTATADPLSLPPVALDIAGGVTFAGGTGSFANAKGTALLTGRETIKPADQQPQQPGVAAYSGKIVLSGCIGIVR